MAVMMKRMLLMLAVMTMIIAGLGFVKFQQIQTAIAQGASFQPPPEAVTTVLAGREEWPDTLSAIGSVAAVQGVVVSADLAGTVDRIAFDSGQAVRQGDVLVQLDTRQERAQLAAAEAQRDLARRNFDRMQGLLKDNVISRAEYDAAAAANKQMEARVGEIRAAIDRKTIRAPFSGLLGIRQVNLGQYLSSGEPIVPLQSLNPIYVNFDVPQQATQHVRRGREVRIASDDGLESSGRITAIDSIVNEHTRNIQVQATLANPDGALRPGLNAAVWQNAAPSPPSDVVDAVRSSDSGLTVTALWLLSSGAWQYHLPAAPAAGTLTSVPAIASLFVVIETGRPAAPPQPSPPQPAPAPIEGGAYLALGDSLAVGAGASDPATQGYVGLFHAWLRQNGSASAALVNSAVRGETTASMIEQGQLQRGLDAIRSRKGDGDPANDVRTITITLGSNDLLDLYRPGGACATADGLNSLTCLLAGPATVRKGQENLRSILTQLRAAAGTDAAIVVTTTYNVYSGTGGPFDSPAVDAAVKALNAAISTVAGEAEVRGVMADFYTPFVGRAPELTLIATGDVHPTNTGYRVLADAVIAAYRQR